MNNIFSICKKEIHSAFVTPLAYVLLAAFLLSSGFFFFTLVQIFNTRLPQAAMLEETMNLNEWVVSPFYATLQILLVFLVPIVTMASFAEEKQRGTFELLLSSPISIGELVWGKFLGSATVVVLMLLFAGVFPLFLIGVGELEVAPVLVGFLGTVIFSLAFVALGLAVSALTKSQGIAAIVGIVAFLLFYMLDTVGVQLGGRLGGILILSAPVARGELMTKGVLESGDLVYFCSVIAFGLFLCRRVIEARRIG